MNTKQMKPKHLSNEDFNAIYGLIRDSTKHPETKPVTGQKVEYREQ